jgi:predicted secreted protein
MIPVRSAIVPAVSIAALICFGFVLTGGADAVDQNQHDFLFTLEPTEGVLLTLMGSKDGEADRGWRLDRGKSKGLDHVDVVDVGVRPARVPPASSDPTGRVKGLFEAPKLWGWGIRARSAGQATVLLRREPPTAAEAPAGAITIEVDVVAESRDARFRLPFREGERAVLELWTNPSTGAQWRIDPEASTGLSSVAVEAGGLYDPSDPTDWRLRDRVGAPMLQEWEIEAVVPGTAHVVLKYGPPWEAKTVYRQLTIDSSVSAPR